MEIEIVVHAQARGAGGVNLRGIDGGDLGAVDQEPHLVLADLNRERVAHLAAGVRLFDRGAVGPVHHRGRISTGAAIGIGLGSFALGSALGSAAAYPYYGGGYYGGGYGYPYAGYGSSYPAYSYGYAPYSRPYYGGYYGTSYAPYYGYGWGY